jgi:uncharacterized protein YdcH (DUF465 family)
LLLAGGRALPFKKETAMSHIPDLAEDFPGQEAQIHALKISDHHFARLVEEYRDLTRTIHRIETRVEPAAEEVEEELKRCRVRLKDDIAAMLANGKT